MIKVSIFIILAMSTMLGITAITEPQSIIYAESESKEEKKKYDKFKEICSNYGDGE